MKNIFLFLALISWTLISCSTESEDDRTSGQEAKNSTITIPSLLVNGSNTHDIVKAYRIAIGDITGNIQYHQSGVLQQKEPCLYAGLVYGKPWTRDAAINVWNGFGLLSPTVSKNTLLAQVDIDAGQKKVIGGQYWDKIIWAIGAWEYYLYSGDKSFLEDAFVIVQNTMKQLEHDEFSMDLGLFRGPAVYGDGVSAYPEIYTRHQDPKKNGTYSGIYQWVEVNDSLKNKTGYGMPMYALSTNTVYYQAYFLLSKMAGELNTTLDTEWEHKAEDMHQSINQHYWNDQKGNYNYLIDDFGNCDHQESMGIAFSLLFDIADYSKAKRIFETTVVEPAGIPCVYPSFKRYRNEQMDSYGRHSGTVWPHIQGFWADAAMKYGQRNAFMHEFNALTQHAIRDFQFVEIYHPTKDTPYGGIQEPHLAEWLEWFCAERQTWSATAYLRMILRNIVGMQFTEKGIYFSPFLSEEVNEVSLLGLEYRDALLDIHISGAGTVIKGFSINGKKTDEFFIDSKSTGKIKIDIEVVTGS